jgi:hypothetical protein
MEYRGALQPVSSGLETRRPPAGPPITDGVGSLAVRITILEPGANRVVIQFEKD